MIFYEIWQKDAERDIDNYPVDHRTGHYFIKFENAQKFIDKENEKRPNGHFLYIADIVTIDEIVKPGYL